jgi:PPOX class probable FMN-dependent enzyme
VTAGDDDDAVVRDARSLWQLIGEPKPATLEKESDSLDEYGRLFLSLCPFICLGTSGPDGRATVSPRGDPPGFVKVLDDHTILVPERPGNRRADSMRHILDNPAVGIVAFVPGVEETLRLGGQGTVVADPGLLTSTEVRGRAAVVGTLVELDYVYFHCGKAVIRSDLWGGRYQVSRDEFPSLAQILRAQRGSGDETALQAEVDDSYTNRLY